MRIYSWKQFRNLWCHRNLTMETGDWSWIPIPAPFMFITFIFTGLCHMFSNPFHPAFSCCVFGVITVKGIGLVKLATLGFHVVSWGVQMRMIGLCPKKEGMAGSFSSSILQNRYSIWGQHQRTYPSANHVYTLYWNIASLFIGKSSN